MPLNSSPPVLDRKSFETKKHIAEKKSCLDFALWGGLTPESIKHLEEMAEAGAVGFKAFMCSTGIEDFHHVDFKNLKKGMRVAAKLRVPVAVHAEIEHPVEVQGQDMSAWLASRPIDFELEAIKLATEISWETGCPLHIVHVSCPEGIDLINQAKEKGVDVTVETCPHYLLLSESEALKIGAPAKCAPPLRPQETMDVMHKKLHKNEIDTLGSDHSPAPMELKEGSDFFKIWGGIAGIQHGLPLLLAKGLISEKMISDKVAERFRLPNKGGFKVGNDADFALIEKSALRISKDMLLTRHPITPYLERCLDYRVSETFLRGVRVGPQTRGRFLKPKIN